MAIPSAIDLSAFHQVSVHINLHRHRPSVTAREGDQKGRVIANPGAVLIHDVTFKVSEAGRARCIEKRQRAVHAWAYGRDPITDLSIIQALADAGAPRVHYNPFRCGAFHTDDNNPVHTARLLAVIGTRAWVLL